MAHDEIGLWPITGSYDLWPYDGLWSYGLWSYGLWSYGKTIRSYGKTIRSYDLWLYDLQSYDLWPMVL